MASIFKKDDNYVDKPNRNTFDLSFQNNLTLKFGKLVPCFCQEVIPGDSFRIKPTFGLRFLPQVFPVQTRMRAHMHFFYVRNRTIWSEWMDFIGKTKDGLTLPYLTSNVSGIFSGVSSLSESSIYDYMGLPVTLDSEINGSSVLYSSEAASQNVNIDAYNISIKNDNNTASYVNVSYSMINGMDGNLLVTDNIGPIRCAYKAFQTPINVDNQGYYDVNSQNYVEFRYILSGVISSYKYYLLARVYSPNELYNNRLCLVRISGTGSNTERLRSFITIDNDSSTDIIESVRITQIYGALCVAPNIDSDPVISSNFSALVEVKPMYNRNYPLSSLSKNSIPYGNGEGQLRISALPFRAYEAVYNSFYRNPENNPFIVDGVREYNKYVSNLSGGQDFFENYFLYNRNWEDDAFTTAVPSPQQGDAPRVGLTGNNQEPVKLFYSNDDGSVGNIELIADANGKVSMFIANGDSRSEALSAALNDAVNFGITINDLRNVNALQLWLEKNVRKGYKYRDQLLSHYGVKVAYNDLLMPEFIGGVSRDVSVNQISQTVETSTGNLGDMAGQAYVVGEGESITHYCDEHGYIIGILSVVPTPNYSQMIPKHFFKHDTFDFYFPEFGKIGMQPILNKEIAATASWLAKKSDGTFGYQRAWYDYLANVDQVHGKFNSDFYNFLLQRKFGAVPELGPSFTTVKNEDLNNIFYSDDNEDKILGQIYYDVKAIRPIPLFGIPSLE